MEKTFKIQKISSKIYLAVIIISFIYGLVFMTQFWNLANFEYTANEPITHFYNSMQSFNFILYYFSIAGLISIAFLFALEIMKKVCDKVAMIAVCVFGGIGIVGSSIVLAMLPGLNSLYADDRLLEFATTEQTDPYWEHIKNFTTFYCGYAIYALLLVTSVTMIVSSVLSNRKYIKEIGGN